MDLYYYLYIAAGFMVLMAVIVGVWAQAKVSSTYEKYRQVESKSGITGAQLVQRISEGAGIAVQLREIGGNLTDNYDPTSHSVNLSRGNFNSSSVASLGIVAHEMGHALQHAKDYTPMKVRQAVIKVSNFTSRLLMPLLIAGVLLMIFSLNPWVGPVVIWAAVGIYFLSFVVSLVTLPVEFNASSRAMKMLEGMGIMDNSELAMTHEVLRAAALTYVASFLISLGYFLRFLMIALSIVGRRK